MPPALRPFERPASLISSFPFFRSRAVAQRSVSLRPRARKLPTLPKSAQGIWLAAPRLTGGMLIAAVGCCARPRVH